MKKLSTPLAILTLLLPLISAHKTRNTHICGNTNTLKVINAGHCRSNEPWNLLEICATGEPRNEELSCQFTYTYFPNEYHFYSWATVDDVAFANVPCQIEGAGDGGVGHYACVYTSEAG